MKELKKDCKEKNFFVGKTIITIIIIAIMVIEETITITAIREEITMDLEIMTIDLVMVTVIGIIIMAIIVIIMAIIITTTKIDLEMTLMVIFLQEVEEVIGTLLTTIVHGISNLIP